MSQHAISSPAFRASISGFCDGASRHPMNVNMEDNSDYSAGYKEGQVAHRAYCEKLCKRMNLINPIVKPAFAAFVTGIK
jgi:hypothetical protein